MSVLVNKSTRLICQGFTGSQGTHFRTHKVTRAQRGVLRG
jgi:succinyl-CoA synthetase alpha subunit